MNVFEYTTKKEMIKYQYDLDLARLELQNKRACLTNYDAYVDDNDTILQMKKRLMLAIEEQKLKIRILLFEMECLQKESKQILQEE